MGRKTKIKLYINRIFISEENNNIIPNYLRFLQGIVDSPDLPLNISRETLQNNRVINKIKNLIITRVLDKLKEQTRLEPDKHLEFLKNFGEVLKEGLCAGSISSKE